MSTDSSDLEPPVETIEHPPDQDSGDIADETKTKKKPSFLKELPVLILIAFGLALLIKTFLIQAFYIPSESMVPTLNIGDRVLVNKVVYKIRDPRRGEVIVFAGRTPGPKRSFWTRFREAITSGLGGAQPAEQDFIKRIIGLPGETIEVKADGVTITPRNGRAFTLREPYRASGSMGQTMGPFVIPKDRYFVMGDNRSNSSDSRSTLGPVRRREIVGRAFIRVWPLKRLRLLRRPGYDASAAAGAVLLAGAIRRRRRRPASRAA